MGLTISEKGLTLIKQFEGCRLSAYQDSIGVWTIGYGHTSGVKSGQTITQAQADAYLKSDCAASEKAVNNYDGTYHWNQNQFDALVSFTFNCGSGNLKTLLNSGKRTIAEISAKITAYNKAGGKVLAGLTNRRNAEKALFDSACDTAADRSVLQAAEKTPFTTGKYYILQNNMYVRESAGGSKKKYLQLTVSAKSNGYEDVEGYGILKKGTVVTCKGIKTVNGATWMKIPSGYVCAIAADGTVYVR